MNKSKKAQMFLLSVAAFALVWAGVALADDIDAATKARIAQFDLGPATIDVSKYPQGVQDRYQLFSQKCSQCHKLSRPINSDFALPSEWSRYIKRMMYKPGSGIRRSQAKKIYEFLVYDSSVRKKALLDKKLAKLTPQQQKQERAKIEGVRKQFGQ